MGKNQLIEVIEQSGVESTTEIALRDAFSPYFEKAAKWAVEAKKIVVKDAAQTDDIRNARTMRLALREVRTDADKVRKTLKEDSLRYGKAVQGVYNVIEYLIAPVEKHLEEQEKFVENQIRIAKEKIQNERAEATEDLREFIPLQDFSGMNEAVFSQMVRIAEATKEAKEAAMAQEEADRKAKEEESREERDRLRKENEDLQEKIRIQNEAARALLEKANAERKEADRKVRLLEEAKRKEEAERQAKIREDKIREEIEARKLAMEQEKAEAAPDKKKLQDFAADILNFELPSMRSPKMQKVRNRAMEMLAEVSDYILKNT